METCFLFIYFFIPFLKIYIYTVFSIAIERVVYFPQTLSLYCHSRPLLAEKTIK